MGGRTARARLSEFRGGRKGEANLSRGRPSPSVNNLLELLALLQFPPRLTLSFS